MNVRQGDVAIVTGGALTPGLAGRIVEVVRLFSGSSRDPVCGIVYAPDESARWVCRSASSSMLPVTDVEYTGPIVFVPERLIADEILRPIRPGELNEDIDAGEKFPKKETA